jgi:hypothetical protein
VFRLVNPHLSELVVTKRILLDLEMSLARLPRIFNIPSRVVLSHLNYPSSLAAYRRFSSSPYRLHASPVPQKQAKNSPTDADPYKDGPSAIDKAVHLFFFTEILRGPCPHTYTYTASVNKKKNPRHVDCARTVLQTPIHDYVSV